MAAAVSSTEDKMATNIIGANLSDDEFHTSLCEHGLQLNESGFIRWGNDNPKHPRNWSGKAKAYNTVIILLLEFITSAVGTAGTAAAQEMQDDFDVGLALSIFCLTSTYLIGQGIGGVFFPPYSEIFGRKTLYIVSTFVYCVFSIITASVHALPAIIIARFLSGLASAVPTIVVAGSIEDLFNTRARVWMIFIWAVIGNAAVCVGPIYSAYVTQSVGWSVKCLFPSLRLCILFLTISQALGVLHRRHRSGIPFGILLLAPGDSSQLAARAGGGCVAQEPAHQGNQDTQPGRGAGLQHPDRSDSPPTPATTLH